MKTNEDTSLKKEIKIHGITIRKMPNGAYFRAINTLKELPNNFIEALDLEEGKQLSDLLDTKNIGNLIVKLLAILPDFTMDFLSELMEIEKDKLENELTPVETIEIVKKFWEINKLSDFFMLVKPMLSKMIPILPIGFNVPSQSVSKLE